MAARPLFLATNIMLLLSLKTQLAESILRAASTTASRWGEQYIILGKPIPGPMRFDHHPWGRVWCDLNEDWVGKKGAQMMMTHACLTRALFAVDILKNDVLYVLPKKSPDAADFSKAKFDVLLDLSPHLRNLFSNVRNVGHKQAGNVNFYLRGSRSRSGLKSISVGLKIFDEFDEMAQKNVPLAEERSAGYQEKDTQTIKISTPTFPEFGISKEYTPTTQEHYFFKCPFCSLNGKPRWTELLDLQNLVLRTESADDKLGLKNSFLQTSCCHHPLPEDKSSFLKESTCRWEPTANRGQADLRGFWIPQLYSMVKPTWLIARQAIRARTDEIENQELHNSVLAKEYVAEGAKVTVEQVEACRGPHHNQSSPRSPVVTMGVDVGHKELYCHIDEWLLPPNLGPNLNSQAVCLTRGIVIVPGFHDLDTLMAQYQILHTVIDVDPVYRDAVDFANRFAGHVNLCRFAKGVKRRDIQPEEGTNELVKQVNRTIWLDQSQSRFRFGRRSIILPNNLPEGYAKMISALIRKDSKDNEGNIVSRYISQNVVDHWAFARVYSEIALPLAISVSQNTNIQNFL